MRAIHVLPVVISFTGAALALAVAPAPGASQQTAGAPHDPHLFACRENGLGSGARYGCQLVAHPNVGSLGPEPVFWHVTRFRRAADAEAAKNARNMVVHRGGKHWVMSLGAKDDKLPHGQHLAAIGPLPLPKASTYQVELYYVEMQPRAHTPVHTHPGPEAWYILEGTQCLDTPAGVVRAGAGEGAMAPPGGTPMELTNDGPGTRRAFFIVIHDPAQPFTAPSDWKPTGACDR